MKEVTHFHYVSSIGYKSAKKVKKKFGSKIIVDDRAEHKGFLFNILKEEYRNLNLSFNEEDFWTVDMRRDYDIADYIITPSSYSKYTFVNQGIPENKLIVIPYGCDITRFSTVRNDRDKVFRVVSVGYICARKGIHYLIDAFKKLNYSNAELVLVGRVEAGLEYLLNDLPDNIKYIPYIPNSQLNELYSKSDVFVLPSLSDSFSLATLEAMASNLPVIVSEHVGAKDVVSEGENGFIVPIRDASAITNKLELLYNNRQLAKDMGNKAREAAINLTWQQYGVKLLDFYKKIQ